MREARQLVEGYLDGHAVEWLSEEILAGGEIRRASLHYDTAGLFTQLGIHTPDVPTAVISVQEGLEALT